MESLLVINAVVETLSTDDIMLGAPTRSQQFGFGINKCSGSFKISQ